MDKGIIAVIVVIGVMVFFWLTFDLYFFARVQRALHVSERTTDAGDLTAVQKDIYMRRMLEGIHPRISIFRVGPSKKERLKVQVERWQNDPERITLEKSGKRPPLSRFEDIMDGLSNL
jgi:hypothetical protein